MHILSVLLIQRTQQTQLLSHPPGIMLGQ